MRAAVGVVLFVAATLIQVTWMPGLSVAGAFPNVVLLATLCIAWRAGTRTGLAWACVGGLLLDLAAPGPLGPHAVAVLAGVFTCGFWMRNLEGDGLARAALAASIATCAYSLALLACNELLRLPNPLPAVAVELTVAAAVINGLAMPVALVVARRLPAAVAA